MPVCQLLEIHGKKFKPYPVGNMGQTSIVGITHTMLFFAVGKNPLNSFFSLCVKILIFRGVPGIVGQFLIVLPDMAQDSFYAVF